MSAAATSTAAPPELPPPGGTDECRTPTLYVEKAHAGVAATTVRDAVSSRLAVGGG